MTGPAYARKEHQVKAWIAVLFVGLGLLAMVYFVSEATAETIVVSQPEPATSYPPAGSYVDSAEDNDRLGKPVDPPSAATPRAAVARVPRKTVRRYSFSRRGPYCLVWRTRCR